MTLGEIIQEYTADHSKRQFLKDSGLSKAYMYMLINNRNNKGKPINPTMEMVRKVANGVHLPPETIVEKLDKDTVIRVKPKLSDTPGASRTRGETITEATEHIINEIARVFDRDAHASTRVPVLGRVAAGVPIEATEEIIDYEDITEEMSRGGEFFGLSIRGDSMEPKISNNDVVIVRQQEDAEDGDIVIALINGNDAVCKRLKKYDNKIALISTNPAYEPMYFSAEEQESIPVRIIGRVVELRAKF